MTLYHLGLSEAYVDTVLRQTSETYVGLNRASEELHNQSFSTVFLRDGHFVCLIGHPKKLVFLIHWVFLQPLMKF